MIRELSEAAAFAVVSRPAVLDGAVNKRDLSTGETRELVRGNVGFGLNPRVEIAPPNSLVSNRRDRPERKNLRNVADTGEKVGERCCQDNGRVEFGRGEGGSPRTVVSNQFS